MKHDPKHDPAFSYGVAAVIVVLLALVVAGGIVAAQTFSQSPQDAFLLLGVLLFLPLRFIAEYVLKLRIFGLQVPPYWQDKSAMAFATGQLLACILAGKHYERFTGIATTALVFIAAWIGGAFFYLLVEIGGEWIWTRVKNALHRNGPGKR